MADYNVGVDTSTIDSLMNTVQNMQQSISSSMSSLAQTMAATTTSAVTNINSMMASMGSGAYNQMGMNSMTNSGIYGSLNPIPIGGSAAGSIYYGQGFAGSLLGAIGAAPPPMGLTSNEFQYMSANHQAQSIVRTGMSGVATLATSLAPMVMMDMLSGNVAGQGSTLGALGSAAKWVAGKAPGASLTAGNLALGAGKVASTLLPVVGNVAGMSAIYELASDTYGSLEENWDIQDNLERNSFRYFRGNAGRGFKRKDRQELASFVQELGVNSMMASGGAGIEDIMELMKRPDFNSYMVGTKDVEDFKSKMEHLVKNVKQVALTLNESFKQATDTLMDLKRMGIGDDASILSATTGLRAAGIASGFTSQEIMGMSKNVGQMFMGTNISQSVAMPVVQTATAMFAAAKENGNISDTLLANVGGFQSAAQRVTALSADFMKNNRNMQALFASMLDEKTGAIDTSKISKFLEGGQSELDVRIEGAAKLTTPQMQAMLRAKMPELMQAAAPQMLALMGSSAEKTKETLMLTRGLSADMAEREAFVSMAHNDEALGEILQGMYKGGASGIDRMVRAREEDARRQAWQKRYESRSLAGTIRKGYAHGVEYLSEGFKESANFLSNKAEDFNLWWAGMERLEEDPLSKYSAKDIKAGAAKYNSGLSDSDIDPMLTPVVGSIAGVSGGSGGPGSGGPGRGPGGSGISAKLAEVAGVRTDDGVNPDIKPGGPSYRPGNMTIRQAYREAINGGDPRLDKRHSYKRDAMAAGNFLTSADRYANAVEGAGKAAVAKHIADVKAAVPMLDVSDEVAYSLKRLGLTPKSGNSFSTLDIEKLDIDSFEYKNSYDSKGSALIEAELEGKGLKPTMPGNYAAEDIIKMDPSDIKNSLAKAHIEEYRNYYIADKESIVGPARSAKSLSIPKNIEYAEAVAKAESADVAKLISEQAMKGFNGGAGVAGKLSKPGLILNKAAEKVAEGAGYLYGGAKSLAGAATSKLGLVGKGLNLTGRAGEALAKGAGSLLGKLSPIASAYGGYVEGKQFGNDINQYLGFEEGSTGASVVNGISETLGSVTGVMTSGPVALALGASLAGAPALMVAGGISGAMSGWNTGANIADYMGWDRNSWSGMGARLAGGLIGGVFGIGSGGWATSVSSAVTSLLVPDKLVRDNAQGNWLTDYATGVGGVQTYNKESKKVNKNKEVVIGKTEGGRIKVAAKNSFDSAVADFEAIMAGKGEIKNSETNYYYSKRSSDGKIKHNDAGEKMDAATQIERNEESKLANFKKYTDILPSEREGKDGSEAADAIAKAKSNINFLKEYSKDMQSNADMLRSSDAEEVVKAQQQMQILNKKYIDTMYKEANESEKEALTKRGNENIRNKTIEERKKGIVAAPISAEKAKESKEYLSKYGEAGRARALRTLTSGTFLDSKGAEHTFSEDTKLKLDDFRKAAQSVLDSKEYAEAEGEDRQELLRQKIDPMYQGFDATTQEFINKNMGINVSKKTGDISIEGMKKSKVYVDKASIGLHANRLSAKKVQDAQRDNARKEAAKFNKDANVTDYFLSLMGKKVDTEVEGEDATTTFNATSKEDKDALFKDLANYDNLQKDKSRKGITSAEIADIDSKSAQGFSALYDRYARIKDKGEKAKTAEGLGGTFKKAAAAKDKFLEKFKGGYVDTEELRKSYADQLGIDTTTEAGNEKLNGIMKGLYSKLDGGYDIAGDDKNTKIKSSEILSKIKEDEVLNKSFLDNATEVKAPTEGGIQHKDLATGGSSLAPEESKAIAQWTMNMESLTASLQRLAGMLNGAHA